ncbi:hypothetical protein Paes_0618 [Prosthecochloris aestuarii DSM 271]|uniref:Uncharacterized protein n=1 Tax=Prosthecochloris aestuarii (strain DSM 271 / SK 413) TaxID=290512 RepID=B4S622_PROA2|nr:hypothetical protein [Prosthecochloris aestuarii]ACF45673.1 hypothetical protein Paes_0618 [Prosthecochloris aestuarii DSM 271]
MHKNGSMSTRERHLHLTISSPTVEFIEHLILKLLHEPFVLVGKKRLGVETVKKLDTPLLSGDIRFVILSPFCLAAPAELIEVGYECGFGEKKCAGLQHGESQLLRERLQLARNLPAAPS